MTGLGSLLCEYLTQHSDIAPPAALCTSQTQGNETRLSYRQFPQNRQKGDIRDTMSCVTLRDNHCFIHVACFRVTMRNVNIFR